ncbi:MAG: oxidoreductase [Pseudonocardiaceae bacterium]
MGWTPSDIPKLTGYTAVVTGANAGLGFEITAALAARGAQIVLACRNTAKADAAADQIQQRYPTATLEVRALDLADLDSVGAFADGLLAAHDRLDILVNNAGLMAIDEARTAQGVEMQFGVNHLGHFALTARLLLATPGSRVATMSSMGHRAARGPADPRGERPYQRWGAYFHSKLANLLFTAELHRRLTDAAAPTIAVAAHPGGSHTDLGTEGSGLLNQAIRILGPRVTQSAALGARPMLRAATDPAVRGGEFYGPRFLAVGATPVRETPSRAARDAATARRLWDLSVQLTGLAPAITR